MPQAPLDPALQTVVNALERGKDRMLASLLDAFNGDEGLLRGDDGQQTLLHRAVDTQRLEAVMLVLDAWRDVGMSLDAPDETGGTALHRSVGLPGVTILFALLDAGLELDVEDRDGCTPLFLAAVQGREDVVQALVRAGADVDAQRHDGTSPLMIAAERSNATMISRLLDAGADPLLAEQGGLTARDLARKSPAEVKAILEKAETWRNAQQRRLLKAVIVDRNGQGGFVMPRDLARSSRDYRADILTDVKNDVERLIKNTLAESPVAVSLPRAPRVSETSMEVSSPTIVLPGTVPRLGSLAPPRPKGR